MINLKALAFDHGLKQKDIAEILGIDQPAASRVINGRLNLTQRHLEKLVQKFGKDTLKHYEVTPEEFYKTRDAQITMIPHSVIEDIKEDLRDEVRAEMRQEAKTATPHPKAEDVEVLEAEDVELPLKETYILTPEIINQEGLDIQKELNEGTLEVQVKPTQDVLPPHEFKIYTENDEMAPDIEVNDPVFARPILTPALFKPRYMYFVDLDIGAVVRWVDWANEEKTLVRLISRKAVDVVPIASVKSMAEIVVITKRPKTLPVDIEPTERKFEKKEQQLNTLLEQQGELIGIIKEQIKHE